MKTLFPILVLVCLCLPCVHGEEHEWTNKQGRTIKAGFVSATNEAVTIFMGGRNFEVRFTNLVPESVELAKRLQGETRVGLKVKNAGPVPGKAWIVPSLGLDLLWCNPGTFMMGNPEEEVNRTETQHKVTLTQGFWLGKYEVTQGQYKGIMDKSERYIRLLKRTVEKSPNLDLPIAGFVSWEDAASFCEKLTGQEQAAGRLPRGYAYQLPTEAQWEYACRAGTKTAFSFGATLSEDQANFGNFAREAKLVGSYKANAWGFHDMHGNVWEWCRDWCHVHGRDWVRDPTGPGAGRFRAYRGGGYGYSGSYCRSTLPLGNVPNFCEPSLGFRLSLGPIQ